MIQAALHMLGAAKLAAIQTRYPASVFKVGRWCRFYPSAHIGIHSEYNKTRICLGDRTAIQGELLTYGRDGCIALGNDSFVGASTHIWSAAQIVIGNRVLISHNVNIFDNLVHPISAQARHQQSLRILAGEQPHDVDLDEKPIFIHDDVLIGCGAIILRGVTIGQGAIIGAGAIVTHDISAWCIAAGNPARAIREIPVQER